MTRRCREAMTEAATLVPIPGAGILRVYVEEATRVASRDRVGWPQQAGWMAHRLVAS